jgi:hypothetical protein
MMSESNGRYSSNIDWFRAVLGSENVILCHTSALECLQLFLGYANEKGIDVYAKSKGKYDNIHYRIVDSFDGIATVSAYGLLCTTVSRTVNDMLDEFENTDEQSLVEGLSDYFYLHNRSFDGLVIEPRNRELFETVKDWAVEYHEFG